MRSGGNALCPESIKRQECRNPDGYNLLNRDFELMVIKPNRNKILWRKYKYVRCETIAAYMEGVAWLQIQDNHRRPARLYERTEIIPDPAL